MPKTQSETSVRLSETTRVYGPIDPERLGQAFETYYKVWKRVVTRSRGGDPEDAIQSALVLLLEGTVQVPLDASDEELFGVGGVPRNVDAALIADLEETLDDDEADENEKASASVLLRHLEAKKHLGTVPRLARLLNRPGPRIHSSEEWGHRPRVTRRRLLDARSVQRVVDDVTRYPDRLWRYLDGDSLRDIEVDANGVSFQAIHYSVRRAVRVLAHQLPDVLREGRKRWFKESHQRVRALLA